MSKDFSQISAAAEKFEETAIAAIGEGTCPECERALTPEEIEACDQQAEFRKNWMANGVRDWFCCACCPVCREGHGFPWYSHDDQEKIKLLRCDGDAEKVRRLEAEDERG